MIQSTNLGSLWLFVLFLDRSLVFESSPPTRSTTWPGIKVEFKLGLDQMPSTPALPVHVIVKLPYNRPEGAVDPPVVSTLSTLAASRSERRR